MNSRKRIELDDDTRKRALDDPTVVAELKRRAQFRADAALKRADATQAAHVQAARDRTQAAKAYADRKHAQAAIVNKMRGRT